MSNLSSTSGELLAQIQALVRLPGRRARLRIEEIPHRSRRILQHIETDLQKCRGGGIDLRNIQALLDGGPGQSRGAKPHAALELAALLRIVEAACRSIASPEFLQHRTHRFERLRGHADIAFGRRAACNRHRQDPGRKKALEHGADVPGRVAEIGHFPIGDAEVQALAGGENKDIVPFHVAMDEAVETPLGTERIEQALEILVLLEERRDRGTDAPEMAEHRVAASAQA